MSSCGCSRRCTCAVTAGPGITVDGNGSAGAPYVITATGGAGATVIQAADSPSVDVTVTGAGTAGDPYLVGAAVVPDPAPPGGGTNLLHTGPDGAYVECADVRGCIAADGGLAYDPATGVVSADLSADAGNGLTLGTDGGLLAPAAEATVVQAADSQTVDVTVTGAGTAGSPYLVGATVTLDLTPPGGGSNLLQSGAGGLFIECDDVRGCLSASGGLVYDPATGVFSADLSADAGNALALGGDGGLFAPAGSGATVVQAADSPSVDVTVTGAGTAGSPYLVGAAVVLDPAPPGGSNLLQSGPGGLFVECDDVRTCLSAGDGITFDAATGEISARLSADAGNTAVVGTDGGLLVPRAAVNAGCGLTGTGEVADPLTVATGVWPYTCDANTAGGIVVCGTDGVLRSEPRGQVSMTTYNEIRDYPDLPVPLAADQLADTFTRTVTNPDLCRPALIVVEREVDVYFTLPAGASASSGYLGDEMYYYRNRGNTTDVDVHTQVVKVLSGGMVPPGGTVNLTVDVSVGRGTNGATYRRILVFIRALLISV